LSTSHQAVSHGGSSTYQKITENGIHECFHQPSHRRSLDVRDESSLELKQGTNYL